MGVAGNLPISRGTSPRPGPCENAVLMPVGALQRAVRGIIRA